MLVFNVSDEVYNLAAETMVALAKPVIDVTSLEPHARNHEPVSQGTFERTLPEPLQEPLRRSTEYLTNSQTEGLKELLHNYQHVFSLSDRDLGTPHMVQHRIKTSNAPPIRQQPRRSSPWKQGKIEQRVTDLLQQGKVKESSSSSRWSVAKAFPPGRF